MPSCSAGDLVWVEGVDDGKLLAACKVQQAESLVVGFTCSVLADCSCPDLVGIRSDLRVEVALYDGDVFLGYFLFNCSYLFVEFLDLLVVMLSCWSIHLNDDDVLRFG